MSHIEQNKSTQSDVNPIESQPSENLAKSAFSAPHTASNLWVGWDSLGNSMFRLEENIKRLDSQITHLCWEGTSAHLHQAAKLAAKKEAIEGLFGARAVEYKAVFVDLLKPEIQRFEGSFESAKQSGVHIAPHSLEVIAAFSLFSKATAANALIEIKSMPVKSSMGVSSKYIKDRVADCIPQQGQGYVNPFHIINALSSGLKYHRLIPEHKIEHYDTLLQSIKEDYSERLKKEVRFAIEDDIPASLNSSEAAQRRLMDTFAYNRESAKDAIDFVASLYRRS